MLAAVRDAVVRYKTWPALQQRALQEMVTEICAEDEVQVENEGEFEETTVIHRSLRHHRSLRQRPLPVEDVHLNSRKNTRIIRIAKQHIEILFRGERSA